MVLEYHSDGGDFVNVRKASGALKRMIRNNLDELRIR